MNSASDDEQAVSRLWKEHLQADFPAGLRGVELAGSDVVMLDADIAGCVSTWHSSNGSLDARRHKILCQCITALDNVLPLLADPDELRYCRRLHQLALLTARFGQGATE
ncbi:hypothetical protein GCM10010277_81860 [Streptomyces longisporoflavus]|uniref:hypothetical protein n=1 Tax=Streptomyces longisporoflavus TaxID=28044 RepID=UPI00167DE7FD|nr:hypothetical protein [Streptomyces longisporoflavus]GGV70696.1 hypothetical protein GCM10010277_81860 [Streptomyces longisporoflavus]